MRAIAIYDLDRTLLRHPSFTPFLIHAARHNARWRLLFVPVWTCAMLWYKSGGCSRRALKQFGLRLFLGRRPDAAQLVSAAESFADKVLPAWLMSKTRRALEADRAEGRILVLATAAMEFYAGEIGRRLGFDHVIATTHVLPDGGSLCLADENCYGEEKPVRLGALLDQLGYRRSECSIRFYSDSTSDAPLLDWADEGVLVDAGARGKAMAQQRGWRLADFNR